jgi:hypothetical protein
MSTLKQSIGKSLKDSEGHSSVGFTFEEVGVDGFPYSTLT